MKKALYALVVAALITLPTAAMAKWGESTGSMYSSTATTVGMTEKSIGNIVITIMNWMLGILGVVAIISFVVAGFMYILAGGDEGKTEKAKGIITYSIIAVVVALIGYVAINTISGLVRGTGTDIGSGL